MEPGSLPAGPAHPGVRCELATLLALRAASGAIRLAPRNPARAEGAGGVRSNVRGRGMDFEEVRSYVPGDDTRTIDWRVTARTGKVHTKIFREERERPVYLCVDQRSAMYFGSRARLKSVQALHAAALLAWSALDGGDRVGGLLFDDTVHHEVRPRRDRRAVLEFLHAGIEFNHRLGIPGAASTPTVGSRGRGAAGAAAGPALRLAEVLTALRRIARPGALVVICSDFSGWDEDAERQLHLLGRHTELCGLLVHDALERALPALGRARVSDGFRELGLDTGDAALGTRLRERFDTRREAVRTALGRIGAPLVELPTDIPAQDALSRHFRGRKPR